MPYYIKKKPRVTAESLARKKSTTEPDLVKKLDRVFSRYIRLRDTMPSGVFQCISCGRIKRFEEGDCGHFYSRTHMATRWDEDNCHAECRACNRFSADHLLGYRERLVRKIGLVRVDRLAVMAHSVKHWQHFELEAMIEHYSQESRRLSKEKGIR